MKQALNTLKIALVATFITISTMAFSQVNIKPAIALFDAGKYDEAIKQLEQTAVKHDRDVKLNYYLGASYVATGKNLSEGIRRLKFAQVKGYQANTSYYLGRAYQLQYEFELAIQSFDKFLRTAKSEQFVARAKQYKAECAASIPLASKIFNLKVIDKYKVTPDSILSVYNPSREVGSVQYNSSFFESDIDPNGVLYRTERGDAVYFSLPNDMGFEKLFKIERLLDGWSEMIPLQGLQSSDNEKTPVLMTDGVSLYFSSDREGGMGGYDIYRTTYDAETRTFSAPVNLGVPFNSSADDYLFVADEFRTRAWFASNRETSTDSVMVYEILWDNSVIRNFAQNTDEIRKAAALRVDPSLAKMRDNFAAKRGGEQKNNAVATKVQKKFDFVVNDSLTYTQWEHFRSAEAKEIFRAGLAMKHEKDSLSAEMTRQRKQFASITDDEQRNAVITGILSIERRIYSLEDKVNEQYSNARIIENKRLEQLVDNDQYLTLGQIDRSAKRTDWDWNKLLKPNNFLTYDSTAFAAAFADDELYRALFTEDDQRELHEADSLYAWSGVVGAEQKKFAQFALAGATVEMTGEDGAPKELTPAEVNDRNVQLGFMATALIHRSCDAKYDIFDDFYEAEREREKEVDFTETDATRKSAAQIYSQAEKMSRQDDDQYKKAAPLKKKAIDTYRKVLLRYSSHKDGSFPLPAKVHSAEPASVVEALNNVDTATVKQGEVVSIFTAKDIDEQNAILDEKEEQVDSVAKPKPRAQTPVIKDVNEKREEKVAIKNLQEKREEKPVEKVVEEKVAEVAETQTANEPESPKTDDTALVTPANGKPVYRIQLGAFKSSPDKQKLASFSNVTTFRIPEKQLTRYYVGNYGRYEDALASLPRVKSMGFSGAFIVAFANGKLIKLSEAQKLE